ncbi:MAG: DinB family protein [Chthonomonadales bacterium]
MISKYREMFQYEIDCNKKMLSMLAGVPKDKQSDPLFQRAVSIVDHLVACRENWLIFMTGSDGKMVDWYDTSAKLETMPGRFDAMHATWTSYLASLTDESVNDDFEFFDNVRVLWSIHGQIDQLAGHAHYHRGQVTLIVDLLGGEVVDTDYADYVYERSEKYGMI